MATTRRSHARPTGGLIPGVLGFTVSATRLRQGPGHGDDNRNQDTITAARNTTLRARALATLTGGEVDTLINGRRKPAHPNSIAARRAA